MKLNKLTPTVAIYVLLGIAILAAITIVAFNGVTARANSSSAQAAALTVIKKIEAYNAENSSYSTHQQSLLGPETVNIFGCEGVGVKVWYMKYDTDS